MENKDVKPENESVKINRSKRRKLNKKILKKTGIDATKLNEAGFYEGMPGVWVDADGNQRIYEIALTPKNELITRFGVHPSSVAKAFQALAEDNPLTRNAMFLAVDKYRAKQKWFKRKQAVKSFFKNLFTRKKKVAEQQGRMMSEHGVSVPANMKVVPKSESDISQSEKKD